MSKGNMLQGMARGKVGDIVFSRVKGQQIARVRNRQPANPRTMPQMMQRVKFAGAASFYRRNKNFFPFAFNNKSATSSEYNAFVKANVGISPYYTKTDVQDGYLYPAPYRVTEGIMPIVAVKSVSAVVANQDIVIVTDLPVSENPTWQEIFSQIGGRIGDMLTFALFAIGEAPTRDCARYIFQHVYTGDEEGTALLSGFQLSSVDGFLAYSIPADQIDTTKINLGACVVNSRYDGKLLVSRNQLVLNAKALATYKMYHDADALEEAAISYGIGLDAELDPRTAEESVAEPVAVENISLSKSALTVEIGGSGVLLVSFSPSNASNKSVVWSSSNESVATVENGMVTGLKAGTAVISATSVDGNHVAECTVTVKAAVLPTGITVKNGNTTINDNLTVAEGSYENLTVTVLPADATNKNFTITSANTGIVEIDDKTKVYGVAPGTTTITITTEAGNVSKTINVTVEEDSGL